MFLTPPSPEGDCSCLLSSHVKLTTQLKYQLLILLFPCTYEKQEQTNIQVRQPQRWTNKQRLFFLVVETIEEQDGEIKMKFTLVTKKGHKQQVWTQLLLLLLLLLIAIIINY